jgi:cytochrome c-type biogenesis protein CcmH/NrfF
LLTLLGASGAQAQEHGSGRPSDLAAKKLGVETRSTLAHTIAQADLAKATGLEVVCLCGTCPKRTITECDCGWAKLNQNAILNAVVKGNQPEAIIAAYREVYGQEVLSMLPNEGINVLAWALPYGSAVVGLGAIFLAGRRLLSRRSAASAPTTPQNPTAPAGDTGAREQLERELQDLD